MKSHRQRQLTTTKGTRRRSYCRPFAAAGLFFFPVRVVRNPGTYFGDLLVMRDWTLYERELSLQNPDPEKTTKQKSNPLAMASLVAINRVQTALIKPLRKYGIRSMTILSKESAEEHKKLVSCRFC